MRIVLWIMRVFPLVAALAVVHLLSACSSTQGGFELLEGLPLPKGAREVERLYIQGSPKNQQLFFIIERPFPDAEILELYNAYFRGKGWLQCRSQTTRTWDWFEDRSSQPIRFVHRATSYWIGPDRKTSVLVSGRYYSMALGKNNAPDNSSQRWAVLVQKDVNAVEEARNLSFDCD